MKGDTQMSTNKTFNKVQLDVKFTQATTRANLISEENISISFGKISKYFADLHSQAFTGYTHPTYTAHSSGLYKITVDSKGHVSAATAVAKSDITALGIPGSDTNTTYTIATGDSKGQIKVTPSSGSAYNVSVKGLGSAAYTESTDYISSSTKIVLHRGNAGKSNMNDVGRLHASVGMTNLSDPGNNYDNPMNGTTKSTDWHLYWDASYKDDPNGSNSWVAQIANKAGTAQWWVRSRKGGTITNGTEWAAGWEHLTITSQAGAGSATNPVYVDSNGHTQACTYSLNKSVPSNAVFTDTKVTSSANHYTPATASGQDKTASASGATAAWGIDVVKGVTLNTDGKGHVTGISVTSGKIPANPVPSNNVTGSGTSGYLVKWNGTNTITNGPQLGSSTTTYLRNDGTWATPTNTNTTYTIATGDSNGQIKVTPSSGSAYNVSVKGLGSAAYTASTDYLSSSTKYAASSSVGGAATSANKLNTNAGATNRPVYFSGGVPVQCDAPESKTWFKGVPLIGTNGVMEIGKIIDFHATNTSEADYDYRIETSTTAMSLIATGSSNTLTIKSPGNTQLSFQTTSSGKAYTASGITCYPLTTSGMTSLFNFGGNVVIGGGEAAKTLYDNDYDTIKTVERETLYLASDSAELHLITDAQTYANRKVLRIIGGQLTKSGGPWIAARDHAPVYSYKGGDGTSGSFFPAIFSKSKTGGWAIGTIGNSDNFYVSYTTDAHYSSDTNTSTYTIQFPHDSGTLALTSSNITGTSANVTGTVAIAHGGTGATTRLAALRALTEENVGTNAQYFLTITQDWGKGGYSSVANVKTVLGLGSAAYKASSDFAVSQTLANDTNLNNITTPGFYNCGSTNSVTNKPSNVDAFGLNVIHDASGQWYTQILYPNNASPLIYVRNYNGSAWSGWNSIAIGSFLPLSGGTMTGTITHPANTVAINLRADGTSTWQNTIMTQSAGDEAVVFANANARTSWMFVNGEDSIAHPENNRWQSLTPALQIKGGCVAIGKLIPSGTTPTTRLDIAGSTALTGDIQLKTSGSSSDDSGDIIWYYGNGKEKMRLWSNNTYTAKSGPNFRVYKSDETLLFNGTLSLSDHTHNYAGSSSAGGAATNIATEVGNSAGARPVFFGYLGDNTRVVYNTNFTYNPSGNVLKASTFDGDITSVAFHNRIYGLSQTPSSSTWNGNETLITSIPSSSGTSTPSYQRVKTIDFIKDCISDLKEPVLYENTTNPSTSTTIQLPNGIPKYLKVFIGVEYSSDGSTYSDTAACINCIDVDMAHTRHGGFIGYDTPGQAGVGNYLAYCYVNVKQNTGSTTAYTVGISYAKFLNLANSTTISNIIARIVKIIAVY